MTDQDLQSAKDALEKLNELLDRADHGNARWRDRVVQEYTKFAQATGIVARDSDPFGPLDFLSKVLYEADCAAQDKIPIRWFKLSESDQEKFRQQGIQTVASWANEELQLKRLQPEFGERLVPRRPGR